ncbi:hypothetical protein IV203_035059 [Nitzschia inconspicua]|uniref:PLC-like phosphodiesterase n=1 Tax=Nitzschia inconspicua TaxID=303405 RepID=A0A9K3LFI9_9STRA|nr:hypothetical protein IV203_035059 [Nitzschia inconspicua]
MGRSSRPVQRKDDDGGGGSCCTWPRIILMVIVLAVSGILIWQFAPVDEAINSILPTYNNTGSSSNVEGPSTGGSNEGGSTTVAPTESPQYQFIQCDDDGQPCCNGLNSNCNLRVNEILYAMPHNAMATFDDGFIFGPNHQRPLEMAVEAGFRGLNLDICNCGGQTIFCHGICSLGPRAVVPVMQNVNTFLDNNPTELIVFVYQVNSAVDQPVDLNAFYNQMASVDGFLDKLYVHPGNNATWPTLGELIDPAVNKRVIMFHYNGPNCNLFPDECPSGLHWYYNYASDNDWEHASVSSITNTDTSCALRANAGGNRVDWIGLNNFVSPPSRDAAQRLNAYDTAKAYIEACSAILNNDINFLITDFWEQGELPRLVQDLNRARALAQIRKRTLLRSQP